MATKKSKDVYSPGQLVAARHKGLTSNSDSSIKYYLMRAQAGDTDAAKSLYKNFAKILLGSRENVLTPYARRVLAKFLLKISYGNDPAKALMLQEKPGNKKWKYLNRDVNIYGDMLGLVKPVPIHTEDGIVRPEPMTQTAAAKLIERSKAYPGMTAKNIENIYSRWAKDPGKVFDSYSVLSPE